MKKLRNITIAVSFICSLAYSGISIVTGPTIVSDDAGGNMSFSGVAVQSGDVVVLSTAPNKDKADNLLSLQWNGSEGVDGTTTSLLSSNLNDRASYVFYVEIENGGSYDFTVAATASNLTAKTGLFVLRAGSGSIAVADSRTLSQNTASPGLSYTFAGSVSGGIAIESMASKNGKTLTSDPAYVLSQNGSGRFILHSTNVSGGGWSKTHSCAEGAQDFVGTGVVFIEQSVAPQPPAFTSDPVAEADAFTNQIYAASLVDNAADPNGDPLTFIVSPTNTWLDVAPDGTLSGLPLAGDLGTNQWTVFVTDGISGTNSATLEIVVTPGIIPQTAQTNIVLIVIDDLGWMDLSIHGSQFYETPRIDQLATNGMRFTQGYAAHPRCLPSRYGLMTGRFPGANGVPGGWPENNLRPAEVTVAEALLAGGYATCFAGKWHLVGTHGSANLPQNQGFDVNFSGGKAGAPPTYFYPYRTGSTPAPTDELDKNALYFEEEGVPGEYVTDRLTDEALDWMDENADQPMFLCMWHYGVHTPFEAPASLVTKYTNKLTTMDYGSLPEEINVGVGQQKMRQDHPIYAAMIESVDTNIGRLMDKVEALGISSNTVFIFTSDNGGLSNRGGNNTRTLATSNYPLRTGKGWLYEGGIREAFIVSGAGVSPMVNSNAVVTGTDIYPTCLELAGLPLQTNDHHDGVSFVSALDGSAYDRGEPIFWHSPQARPYSTGDFNSSAVRDGDYKLIWFFDTPGQPYELYNVKTDLGENNDLSESMPAKAAELLGKIQAWHAGAHDGSGVVFRPDDNDVSKPPQTYLDDPKVPLSFEPPDLLWGDYTGYDYNLFSKTNLMDATWTTEASGLTTTNQTLPMTGNEEFYKVELVLQTEA